MHDVRDEGTVFLRTQESRRSPRVAVYEVGDIVQRVVVKSQEDVAGAIRLAADEFEVAMGLLFNHLGRIMLKYPRFRIGMGQNLFASAVFLRGMKGEQVLLAIYIEHTVEGCPAEVAARPVDCLERTKTVERYLVRPNAHHWAISRV